MKHPPLPTFLVWLAATAALCPLPAQDAAAALPATGPAEVPPPLAARFPALLEQSAWRQDAALGDADARRGAYPVGNGRVFAHLGLGRRANTLRGLTGPHYGSTQRFQALTLDLVEADSGAPIELPLQRVRRVLGANFVITEDAAPGGLALRTLSFAPPGEPALVRVVELHNVAHQDLKPTRLVASFATPSAEVRGRRLLLRSGTVERGVTATVALAGAEVRDGRLVAPIPALASGERWRAVLRVDTFVDGDAGARRRDASAAPPADEPDTSLESAVAAVERTFSDWRQKLADTTRYDTDHTALRDLVRDWKVLVHTLRCARTGIVVPTPGGRTAPGVRDQNGAMLLFLRFGMWDEARDILEYVYDVTRLAGRVPEDLQIGRNLDLETLGDAEPEWNTIELPRGDVPSWIVLQHFWYWRATQDTALIRRHQNLLLACVKRQSRSRDNLMTFHGAEPYLGGGLYGLADRFDTDPELFGNDPSIGRNAYSLASAVLFLTCVHAVGEMLNGIDRVDHPEKYATDEAGVDRPGDPWARRVYELMTDIERRYWLQDAGLFAPAISAVDEAPHPIPLANVNLMPLWVGWTYPTGEKSRDNLRNSLELLWRRGARIGTTPTLGASTGDLHGMLLTALAERDCKRRSDVIDVLLEQARPAGAWARFYGPGGLPVDRDADQPERLRPGESGVNLDAILFAVTGIRHVSVPNFDSRSDLRLELRLPNGASYFTVKDTRKDGRRLDVFFRETESVLTEAEREANDQLDPDKRRDPSVPHRRIRFVVDLLEGDPPKGYYDVALNAAGTMFVRYLKVDDPNLRRIDEMEFAGADRDEFLPAGRARPPERPTRGLRESAAARVLALGVRPALRELLDPSSTTFFDSGFPFRTDDLRKLLLGADGARAHASVLLDWNFDAGPPASFVPRGFWSGATFGNLLERFEAAGGEVLRVRFVARYAWHDGADWRDEDVAAGGPIRLRPEQSPRLRIPVPARERTETVLQLGTGCGVRATWNGEALLEREGPRPAVPDQDSRLVTARRGENLLELTLTGDGERVVYVRFTDSAGHPAALQ